MYIYNLKECLSVHYQVVTNHIFLKHAMCLSTLIYALIVPFILIIITVNIKLYIFPLPPNNFVKQGKF